MSLAKGDAPGCFLRVIKILKQVGLIRQGGKEKLQQNVFLS